MPRYLWLRIALVAAVIIGSAILIFPRDWRGRPRQPINLGLDLQGGIHLVLGVDLEKGVENVLDRPVDLGLDLTILGAQLQERNHWSQKYCFL